MRCGASNMPVTGRQGGRRYSGTGVSQIPANLLLFPANLMFSLGHGPFGVPAPLRPPPRGAGTGGKDALRGRAMSTPCVAQARLSRTRSFKLRAIINSYPPIIMRSPHPHF